MSEAQQKSKKISVGLVLSWVFGVLFGLTGIISVFSEPIPGIIMLVMAAVLLPPINKLVDKKWKLHLSGGIKVVTIIIGFFIFSTTVDTSSTVKQQDIQPKTQQGQQPAISKTEQPKEEQQITNDKPAIQDEQTDKQVDEEQPQTETQVQKTNEEKTEIIPTSEEKAETPKEDTTPKKIKPIVASFGNGTHIIGTDIQAGTYRSQGTKTCYWARLSGFSGQLDDIIANGNNSPEIITISASDAAFKTAGCGQWVAIESTYPTTPSISFLDGTYKVEKHIAPGTYRADGSPDDLCYWARLSNFSHAGISGVITNGNSPAVIQISSSDKGFSTFGCGNWTKIK